MKQDRIELPAGLREELQRLEVRKVALLQGFIFSVDTTAQWRPSDDLSCLLRVTPEAAEREKEG